MERGISLIDEHSTIDPLERAVEYIMLGMRTSRGISEREYRYRCQCDWKPIYKILLAFQEKGWVEKNGERWHFTIPGFLISNTLIGIMLEAQASNRVESAPWLRDGDEAAEEIVLPKGEEELFQELYKQRTDKTVI